MKQCGERGAERGTETHFFKLIFTKRTLSNSQSREPCHMCTMKQINDNEMFLPQHLGPKQNSRHYGGSSQLYEGLFGDKFCAGIFEVLAWSLRKLQIIFSCLFTSKIKTSSTLIRQLLTSTYRCWLEVFFSFLWIMNIAHSLQPFTLNERLKLSNLHQNFFFKH